MCHRQKEEGLQEENHPQTVAGRFGGQPDHLIYNDPLGYADLILNGDPEEYLKNAAGSHGLEI